MAKGGANAEQRPSSVVVQNLDDGQVMVCLPSEFNGEVKLQCQGGVVAKVRVDSVSRPLGYTELTETLQG